MEIIRNPSVYLLGRQEVDEQTLAGFLEDHDVESWTTDTEVGGQKLSEVAGRVCYMSFAKPRPGGNATYLGHILEVGHGSVLEHAAWNFIFTGISRTCSHELVRHRAGVGYSMLSQRYVDESVAEYVMPHDLQLALDCHYYMSAISPKGDQDEADMNESEADREWPNVCVFIEKSGLSAYYDAAEAGKLWLQTVENSHAAYVKLCDYLAKTAEAVGLKGTEGRKFARQAARSVLPNATETKIFVTMNARAIRHFIEMRCSRHAEPEIRKLAAGVLEVMRVEAPAIFGDYTLTTLPDGTCEATTQHRKV